MKKYYLLILIGLSFFISGCSANYTLKYEDGTFVEYLELIGEGTDGDAYPTFSEALENGVYATINGDEKFTIDESSIETDASLTHKLESNDLGELSVVEDCFNLHTFIENDGSYYFSAYGGFTCTYLEDSTFTLETDNEVIMNNANEVDGNKYIWNLNEDDLEDGIKFQIKKESSTTSITSGVSNDTVTPLWLKIVIVVLIVGIGGILIFLLNKVKER